MCIRDRCSAASATPATSSAAPAMGPRAASRSVTPTRPTTVSCSATAAGPGNAPWSPAPATPSTA
eukprot:1018252-Alexandrium_andersonii.AAC.1